MLVADLHYTPALVRRATFAYIRRGMGTAGVFSIACVIIGAFFLGTINPGSWLSGVITGAAVVLLASIVGVYLLHYRLGMAKLRRMGTPHAVLRVDDSAFLVSSQSGTFSVPWETFSDVWRFPEYWLLIWGRGQFLTLPLDDLSDEIRSFISSRISFVR